MGLETGTFVEDLVVTNPPGGDSKSQGDDHLRLIKNVLRNTFKRATKALSFPGSVAKSANYTVLSTDDNLTILCDTTAAFTLTLPTLAVGDAGWNIFIVKTTLDANPVFIAPPSGTINGFSKVRRSVEFVATRILWTGGIFVATRPFGDPIGASVDYHGSTLPNGYLWADGAAFNAANYVELNAKLGGSNAPDLRGRASFGRDNMGVGAANRLTQAAISGITGTTLGSAGGTEVVTLGVTQLPAHTHSGTTNIQDTDHRHTGTTNQNSGHQHNAFIGDDGHTHTLGDSLTTTQVGGSFNTIRGDGGTSNLTGSRSTGVRVRSTAGTAASADDKVSLENSHTHGFSGVAMSIQSADHKHTYTTDSGTGGGLAHNTMPPALIVNKIVVAE